MSEAELREGLRAAVGDEPPLHFDADELIRRGRHERKRRRALVAVGVATLVLTGTVLSLPGLLAPRSAGPAGVDPARFDAASQPVLTTTAAPAPPVGTTAPPTAATTRAADTKLLAAYASQRLAAVAPGVKVLRAEFTEERARYPSGSVTGFVHFLDAQGVSGVTARLSPPSTPVTRELFCAAAECGDPRPLDDGSHLEFATATTTQPDDELITYSVAHFRADGSVVQVNAYNYDPVDGGGVRRGTALSHDQLVRLATDPGFAPW